jgi:hypothetical protein
MQEKLGLLSRVEKYIYIYIYIYIYRVDQKIAIKTVE